MAVQKEILKRTVDIPLSGIEGNKTLASKTGTLVGGIPGKIYDVAYGPVAHTASLTESADIGTYVADKGVIINAPEYALYGTLPTVNAQNEVTGGPLYPSLTLPAGSVASFMTAGHIWVKYGTEKDKILAAMNGRLLFTTGTKEGDLCVIEINGFKDAGGDSSSN